MKSFISGASGFAGCRLVELLKSSEHEIFGTTFPDKPDQTAICKEGEFWHQDIRTWDTTGDIIQKVQPDWIFHLAAVSNVRHSWDHRRETIETNVLGTFNLLEAVRKHSPSARFLFISSSDVYGVLAPRTRALIESDPLCPVNPYAYTKISGELLCQYYTEIEGLDIVISRSFPHTGPGQSPDFVCSDWARQVARIEKGMNEPVINVGNIEVQRDFSDVRDVVLAYRMLLEGGRRGEVYNVCSGRTVSLKDILDRFLSLAEVKIEVRVDRGKMRKTDIPLLFGDNSKIRNQVSWEPKIDLDQTLKDVLDYWRKRVSLPA